MSSSDEPRVFNGRYQLHRRIAHGGMAEVYLARDLLLDRPVALKVLFPQFASDPSFVERFRREAQAAANLSHPNIVSVYDWGEEDSTYFIVMEYVEGRSLAQILRDEGPLLPDRAADIATDIAAALGFAHRNGVVHRDVKPGNVLISPLGQVKVTDFGIARALTTDAHLTQTGTVMGTATYFSPEQARGEPVDPRSDVYSLGVVLYESLVGEPPFSGDSPVAVAYKHVQEPPERPTRRNPAVPGALEAIAMKALAKNPANRYASAEELAADLRRFREGQPVVAEAILPDDEATRTLAAATVWQGPTTVGAGPPTAALPPVGMVGDPGSGGLPPRRNATFLAVLLLLLGALAIALVVLFGKLGDDGVGTQVQVPKVVSMTQPQAIAQLEGLGFSVKTKQDSGSDQPDGTVTEQDPAPGTKADKGSTVTITVSSGQPPVSVPELIGRQEDDAQSRLRSAGLVADVQRRTSDRRAGEVIDQDPRAGEQLPKGSAVRIVVSSGQETEVVPDVSRLTREQAQSRLERSGFQVEFADEPSSTVEKGLVTRTDPPAGDEAAQGDVVRVYVSSGPQDAAVPDVVGLDAATATTRLRKAGFQVSRINRPVLDPEQDGHVVDQSPDGGQTTSPGSTVTIVVGAFAGGSSSTSSTTTTTTP